MENLETLKQASKEFANSKKWMDKGIESWVEHTFIEGAKWEQKRIENDMIEFSWWLTKNLGQFSDDYTTHFKGEYLKQWQQLNK